MARTQTGDILGQVQVRHGPPEVIGRVLLQGYDAARSHGLSLRLATFDELVAVNAANRESWVPLVPMFDPRDSALGAEDSLCLFGVTDAGQVVATQALRLFDWQQTTLAEEVVSLRFSYRDPAAALARGERCSVTAPSAHAIRGRIAFSGATWYHPSFRGRGLLHFIPRVARAIALTSWNMDMLIALQAARIAEKGVIARSGFVHLEGVIRFENSPAVGSVDSWLGWATRDELVADLTAFVEEADAAAAIAALGSDRGA